MMVKQKLNTAGAHIPNIANRYQVHVCVGMDSGVIRCACGAVWSK